LHPGLQGGYVRRRTTGCDANLFRTPSRSTPSTMLNELVKVESTLTRACHPARRNPRRPPADMGDANPRHAAWIVARKSKTNRRAVVRRFALRAPTSAGCLSSTLPSARGRILGAPDTAGVSLSSRRFREARMMSFQRGTPAAEIVDRFNICRSPSACLSSSSIYLSLSLSLPLSVSSAFTLLFPRIDNNNFTSRLARRAN